MKLENIYFYILIILFLRHNHGRQIKKFVQIVNHQICNSNRNLISTDNIHGSVINNTFFLRGYLEVLGDIEENIKVSRTIESCLINQAWTPCIPFGQYDEPDFCGSWKREDGIFKKYLFPFVEPKIVCPPLKKGRYDISKTAIDLSPILNMPVEGKEWKQNVTMKTVKSDIVVYCASSVVKVYEQSSRKRV